MNGAGRIARTVSAAPASSIACSASLVCGVAARWRLGPGLATPFLLLRPFVTFTPVIRRVKARALEEDARALADQPPDLSLTPRFLPAKRFWANLERRLAHGLKCLEALPAFLARVIVVRHWLAGSGGHGRRVGPAVPAVNPARRTSPRSA